MDKEIFIQHLDEISTINGKEIKGTELAEIMGCSPAQASKIRNPENDMPPNIDNLINLADWYNVSIDWLVGRDSYRIPDKWYGSYADILRFIIGIVDLEDLQHLTPGWEISVNKKECKSTMTCTDSTIADFFKEWVEIREKYKSGVIDRHLYDLWLNDQLQFYAKQKPDHRYVEAVWDPDEPKPEPVSPEQQAADHDAFIKNPSVVHHTYSDDTSDETFDENPSQNHVDK